MGDAEENQGPESESARSDLDTHAPLVRQRPPADGPTVVHDQRSRRGSAPVVATDSAPGAGWYRMVLRTRHGVDRDFVVLGQNLDPWFYIASGYFLRSTGEVRTHDRDGAPVYLLRGQVLGLPRQIAIRQPSGVTVAQVRAKRRSPLASPVRIRVGTRTQWQTTGSLAKRQYAVAESGTPVIKVDQKSVQIRDSCKVDVADGIDPALAAAVVWAIDELLAD